MTVTKIEIECYHCKTKFTRTKTEHNRSLKLGRKAFCSRSCAAKVNVFNLKEHKGKGNAENLRGRSSNRRDEYTEFKWFMRCVRRRSKEYDIDLPFLKELWLEQKGICPLTGWELELPKHSTDWHSKENKMFRASLDRIDSQLGYVKGNVRFIAVIANYCKNQFSDSEVRLFCEAVVSNQ